HSRAWVQTFRLTDHPTARTGDGERTTPEPCAEIAWLLPALSSRPARNMPPNGWNRATRRPGRETWSHFAAYHQRRPSGPSLQTGAPRSPTEGRNVPVISTAFRRSIKRTVGPGPNPVGVAGQPDRTA